MALFPPALLQAEFLPVPSLVAVWALFPEGQSVLVLFPRVGL